MVKPKRILIADDHALFRAGLSRVLDEMVGLEVVGEVEDGRKAVSAVAELRPDVILLDISMPELNGVEAAHSIGKSYPDTKILVVSVHREEAYVARALRAGAHGYLLKDAAVDELRLAINTVIAGELYLSPGVARPLVMDYLDRSLDGDAEYNRLTPRQVEVLQLVGEGCTTKEIGERLHLSPRTVESHRKQLMIVLGEGDLAGLVRAAVRLKLVTA